MANQLLAGLTLRVRGGRPLKGDVTVRGAKNTLPKILLASLLTDQRCVLRNVADVRDVRVVAELLRHLGASVSALDSDVLSAHTRSVHRRNLRRMLAFAGESRVPLLSAGPLLHRFKQACVIYPGGCSLGARTIDYHLDVLRAFGVEVTPAADSVWLAASRLHPCHHVLPSPSVGATEQFLFTAARISGESVLENAAVDPEILDLVGVLLQMGVQITIDPPRTLRIVGNPELAGYDYSAMTDRSEVASWAATALATDGRLLVKNAHLADLEHFLDVFTQCGGGYERQASGVYFFRAGEMTRPVEIITRPHPGFRTDWQPPLVAALTAARKSSVIHETVFAERFGYLTGLRSLGAKCSLVASHPKAETCDLCRRGSPHIAVISGRSQLHGTEIAIQDIRGGFACLIGALMADGTTVIRNPRLLAKGYEKIYEKLLATGADIQLHDHLSPGSHETTRTVVPSDKNAPSSLALLLAQQSPSHAKQFVQRVYDEYYETMLAAESNSEKGKSLEDLATYVFGCLPNVQRISKRVVGMAAQHDIIAENVCNTGHWIFVGGAFVVECKNEAGPVEAPDIHALFGKLQSMHLPCGFIVTTRTLSRGAVIVAMGHREAGTRILAIEGSDLKAIRGGKFPEDVLGEVLERWLFK